MATSDTSEDSVGLLERFAIVPAWGFPALVAVLIGWPLGSLINAPAGVAFFLVCIWTGLLIVWGLKIVREQEFFVIERFGRFFSVKVRGVRFLLMPGVIDHIRLHKTFTAQEVDLYADDEGNELDFTDGSAPINASAWYHIANPTDVRKGNWDAVKEQVRCFTYTVGDREKRIAQLFEGALRPLMQAMSIDQAQKSSDKAAQDAADKAGRGLKLIGVYPREEEAIIVHDVEIPNLIQEIRTRRLEGEANAQQATKEALGYAQSIKAIMVELSVDSVEATRIYENQRALGAIQHTGANVTLVAPGITGVIGTLDMGKKG